MVFGFGPIIVWLTLVYFYPFFLISLGFSQSYFLPYGSLLVKLKDNRFTCLTNPVRTKHSLTSPVKMRFRGDSHHYLLYFLNNVKIRFTLSNHLFLFSLLCENFELFVHYVFMSMSYIKFYGLQHCFPLRKLSVPLTHKQEFQRSIFEFIYSSAFSIPCLS